MANFHAITPFPGTYLYDHVDKLGTISPMLSDFTYQGAAFVPNTMTRDDIQKLRQIAFRKFYLRPSFIWNKLLHLRSPSDLKVAYKSAKSLFWVLTRKDLFSKKEKNTTIPHAG
jgi:hypothetical protein